ncbi:MAG: AI-2E family transporter [Parvibaculaceae bacterium]
MPGTPVSLQRQVTFWVVALVAFILMVWLFSDILLPFIAGFVLAYFLDPVADALERLGMPRIVAVAIILVASVLIVALAAMIVFPILADQLTKAAQRLPEQLRALAVTFDQSAPAWLQDMIRQTGANMPTPGADMAGRVAGWLTAFLASVVTGSLALVNLVSLMIITPIVAFYLLLDWDRMVSSVDRWLPRDHAETIRDLARQINMALAGFIRGQGTVCVVLGLFYAVGLTLIGLNFGLLIGLSVGLLCFIPVVGTFVGAVITVLVAVIQFWPDWLKIVMVGGIFAIGQFLEGNFLSPKLVGDRVGVHPVWLMFALFAFGYLFGFTGVLLAVPLAAVVGVLCRFGLKQYMASKLYLGQQEAADPPGPP